MNKKSIICVVGARPNFMKMAPILRALAAVDNTYSLLLVHTGQHYDKDMSDKLFEDLKLPRPDINLEVGSGSHAVQTSEVMRRFEPILDNSNPACVIVVGDVNSTLACTLVAVKKGIRVVHVEAGLRSHDRSMPEEINRVLTDQIADRLYTTERSAQENLRSEGIAVDKICFVGNVMIDTLLHNKKYAFPFLETMHANGVSNFDFSNNKNYGLVTLHRPSNVDDASVLEDLLNTLKIVAKKIPLIFVLHPRTRANIERFSLSSIIDPTCMVLLSPQGYLEMLGLTLSSLVVLTDSGGLQEETTALGVPCLTLRENTERPITVEEGTNTIVGRERTGIIAAVDNILAGKGKHGKVPEFWEGRAAERIVADLEKWLN